MPARRKPATSESDSDLEGFQRTQAKIEKVRIDPPCTNLNQLTVGQLKKDRKRKFENVVKDSRSELEKLMGEFYQNKEQERQRRRVSLETCLARESH